MNLISYACPEELRVIPGAASRALNTQRFSRHQIRPSHPLPGKDDEVMLSTRTWVLSLKKVVENRRSTTDPGPWRR